MADFAQILIKAKDETKGAFDSATRNVRGLETAAGKLNGALGALGLGVTAAGMVALAKSGIDAADALQDLSDRTGVSVKTLAEWKLAADLSDTSIEALAKGVQRLTLSIGQAEQGLTTQAKALKTLGVTARDPKIAFEQLADAVAKSNDPIKTNAALNDVLGRSYTELLPLLQGGAQGLRDSAAASETFSEAMARLAPEASKFNDQLDTLKANAAGVAATILSKVVPSLNEWITTGREVLKTGTLLDKVRFFALGNASDDMVKRVRDAAAAAEAASAAASARALAAQPATDNSARIACIAAGGTWDGTRCVPKKTAASGKAFDVDQMRIDDLAEAWKAADAELKQYLDDEAWLAQADLERDAAVAALANEWTEAGRALTQEMATPLEQLEQRLDYINELWRRGVIDVETYDRAFEAAMGNAAEQVDTIKNAAQDFGLTFTSALEDAIVAGDGVSEMLAGLEQDFARMLVRMSVTQPLMNAVSGTDWGALLGGIFGSAKGNAFAGVPGLSAYSGTVVDRPTLFPFAAGAGLMGEAGPEAILPLKRGADGRLGVEGGSGGVVVNVINNAGGTQATATEREDNGVRIIDVMVEQVEGSMSRRIGRGEGLAPTLERRYGLNPAAGAY